MSKKRFDHFMNFWQQVLNTPRSKTASSRRTLKAKSRLRLTLTAR